MFKFAVLVCAQALIQSISGQCIDAAYGPWAAAPLAGPFETIAPIGLLGPAALAASNGAGLAVTSMSPIAPTGVFMTSENCYEGPLAVTGAIPFLGAVALEGALATVGGGAVAYGCGDGNVAILSEDIAAPYGFGPYGYDGLAAPYGFGPYGYDGLAAPYGFGPYGYDGLAAPYGFGPYGYDGLAAPYGLGPYAYDGLAGPYGYPGPYGNGPYGYGCAGPRL